MCRVSLAGSTVSFIKATAEGETGTVKLVYDGQTFFTTEITVAQKPLSKDDVTITGINDKYPSHEAAEAAKDGIGIVYDGKKLTTDDYTVSREDGMFTITFERNYSETVKAGLPGRDRPTHCHRFRRYLYLRRSESHHRR